MTFGHTQSVLAADRLPPPAADGGELVLYDEYVRGFDEVPVLSDAVTPRRSPPPDFRTGERPNRRKEPRPDAWVLREAQAGELATLYHEYEGGAAATKSAKPAKKRAARGKSRKRGRKKKR